MTPAEVVHTLESAGVQFALVGAMAVAARARLPKDAQGLWHQLQRDTA